MSLSCQGPSCDHEFHDAVLDPHEAISGGFEDVLYQHDRPAPDGFGVQTLYFCSFECLAEWEGGSR